MSFKNRILKYSDAACYSMPLLEDESIQECGEIIQKAEDIERQAYEEGFHAGEKAGFAEGEQKAALLIEHFEKIIRELVQFKENFVEMLEAQVVDLTIAVAHKVIMDEIDTNPEVIITMVKEALKRLERTGAITIRINPALYDLFNKKKSELVDIHEDIVFDVNSSVPVSGPLVISRTEEVVIDVESLLKNVVNDMKGNARKREDDVIDDN